MKGFYLGGLLVLAFIAGTDGDRKVEWNLESGNLELNESLSSESPEYKVLLTLKEYDGADRELIPRITTFSPNGIIDVSIRYSDGKSLIWRNSPGKRISRYLCSVSSNLLLMTVSTFNSSQIDFEILAELEDIDIHPDDELSFSVFPESPVVRRFLTPRLGSVDRRYTIVTRSNDSSCGLVGIQPLTCPFLDAESSMVFRAKWQTLLGISAMDIRTSDSKYARGFYILIITKSNSEVCTNKPSYESFDVKDLALTVYEEDYFPLGTSILIVLIYLFTYGIGIAFTLCCTYPIEGKVAVKIRPKRRRQNADVYDSNDVERRSLDFVDSNPHTLPSKVNKYTSTADIQPARVKEILIIDEEEVKQIRSKKELNLNDLALTCDYDRFPHTLHMKSSLYVWIIFLMGIFYTLPVFQLVKNYEKVSDKTGDENICYYNYLCKVDWAYLKDYGHVFSNIGYIISGLCFILITSIRRIRYNIYMEDTSKNRKGIPEQYGVFFAMGGALCMEGVLSGCYHICPTAENFQFDTTFMYVLAVLVFLKVFQFRHPDITANAYIVFAVIGGALIFEVVGIYLSNIAFWIVFIMSYVLVVIFFVIQTYYNGMLCHFIDAWKSIFRKLYRQRQTPKLIDFSPVRRGKFIASITIILVNLGLAVFFAFKRKPGVSRYLLLILMVNMALYVGYYICMKLYYRFAQKVMGESISWRCYLYFLCMNVCIVSSVIFFVMELKNSSKSPAESRNINERCLVSFFDNHDLWHFLSAAGLFFNFMMILTLEDENLDTPWEEIPVF